MFILPSADATKELVLPRSPDGGGGGVTLREEGGTIRIEVDGDLFTVYHFAGVEARPYFWPVLAPGGIPVTRAYPMRSDVPGETSDHRHHRSLYIAHGSVNGTDNWSEEPGHGFTVHDTTDEMVSGPVFGRMATTSFWTDREGRRILEQKLSVTVWRGSAEYRMMDVDVTLIASYGDVLFGDTKEGGILSVRVATPMDVRNGGRILNSWGGINEQETWGRPAHWCSYWGTVQDRPVGIAVMDHPVSFRHPTYWHVRDYGLMTANPFAWHDYTGGRIRGDYVLQAGSRLGFRYRVLVCTGEPDAADLAGRYLDFVAPPVARAV
ncbi:MAG: PmoA family protein [Chthonomonadales bacterium]